MEIKRQSILIQIIVMVVLLGFSSNTFAALVTFQGLGVGTEAYDISADGKVVVGQVGTQAFRWTATAGLQDLGPGIARSVSGDGSVVVGDTGYEGFCWTADSGIVELGVVPHSSRSREFRVSKDGNTIVGWSQFAGFGGAAYGVFSWTAETGIEYLGRLSGYYSSMAYSVSADGSAIVGRSDSTGSNFYDYRGEAFQWTNDSGFVGLGGFGNDTSFSSWAMGVSNDGSIVVGSCTLHGNVQREAFRWTSDGGMVLLRIPGEDWHIESYACDVSGDGSVVVGSSGRAYTPETYLAFLWTEELGMVSVKDILENQYGLNLSGWILSDATGISDDGLTIVGYGTNPDGLTEGWIATIPEPSTFLLISIGVALLRKRR